MDVYGKYLSLAGNGKWPPLNWSLVESTIGIPGCLTAWYAHNSVSSVTDSAIMMLSQCLLICWCGCPALSQILAAQEKPTAPLSWSLLWSSHFRSMFEAPTSTGLWWVLWQTWQPCFPQRVSASGIPTCPGSPSLCTQSLFLKIRSVSWENREILLVLKGLMQVAQYLWIGSLDSPWAVQP